MSGQVDPLSCSHLGCVINNDVNIYHATLVFQDVWRILFKVFQFSVLPICLLISYIHKFEIRGGWKKSNQDLLKSYLLTRLEIAYDFSTEAWYCIKDSSLLAQAPYLPRS